MVSKKGIYSKAEDGRCTLMFNGQEVCERLFGGATKSGIYVNGNRLELYGNVIAQSSKDDPKLYEKNGSLMFGEVDMTTADRCINISLIDYNKLLAGETIDGYKAYSPDDVYNVIPENSTADELTFTESNGIYTFSNGTTAKADSRFVYNNGSALPVNVEDLTQTVLNTNAPQIYVRYFDPIIVVGDTIEIEYHVDDITMSALNYDKVEDTFTVIIKTASGSTTSRTTYAGMYKLTTPAFPTEGETWFSVRCIDSNGVSSIEQFFDILVKTSLEVVDNPYTMTTDDLDFTYNDVAYHIVPEDSTVSVAIANKAAFTAFFAKVKTEGYNRVILLNRTYWIDYHQKNGQPRVSNGRNYGGDYIEFPNHFTVDLNGATLRATQCTDIASAEMIFLSGNVDTHIKNGTLMGNYTGFDFATTAATLDTSSPSEWLGVLNFKSARYCSAENLNVSDAVGYDCTFGALNTNVGHWLSSIGITDGKRVDLSTGNVIDAENMVVSGTFGVTGGECIAFGRNGYGKYLNFGTQREIFYSFYGTGGIYIGTIKSHLYRLVHVPSMATSARITGYGKILASGQSNDTDWSSSTSQGQAMVFRPSLCINMEIKSCNWSHTRTTAITNPSTNGLLIDGCTYTDIALENGAYKVTPAIGDFEDSWHWGNNVTFRNCTCVKGSGKDDIIIHYIHGFEFANNTGIAITEYGGIEKGYIHDNSIPTIYMERNRSCYHPFVVYDGNTIGNLSVSYGTWKHNAIAWTIAYAERVVSMINSTIRTKCYYAYLKLRNCRNGSDIIN